MSTCYRGIATWTDWKGISMYETNEISVWAYLIYVMVFRDILQNGTTMQVYGKMQPKLYLQKTMLV